MGMGEVAAISISRGLVALQGPHQVAENVIMQLLLFSLRKVVNSSGLLSSVKVMMDSDKYGTCRDGELFGIVSRRVPKCAAKNGQRIRNVPKDFSFATKLPLLWRFPIV